MMYRLKKKSIFKNNILIGGTVVYIVGSLPPKMSDIFPYRYLLY